MTLCLVLRARGRADFEVSEWDHWDTGKHRIWLLAEISDELVFSGVGWVPAPAGSGPLALPREGLQGGILSCVL